MWILVLLIILISLICVFYSYKTERIAETKTLILMYSDRNSVYPGGGRAWIKDTKYKNDYTCLEHCHGLLDAYLRINYNKALIDYSFEIDRTIAAHINQKLNYSFYILIGDVKLIVKFIYEA